jgi:hypothetical protein
LGIGPEVLNLPNNHSCDTGLRSGYRLAILSFIFILNNLCDELAVIAIIRALSHSFKDIIRTISILGQV